MRRAVLLAVLLAVAAPPVARAGDAPRLRAVVSSCDAGTDPTTRAASFTASMPARADTARMAIRFDLQQRTVDGGVWRRVAARSFGRWERSRADVAGFVYTKEVQGLPAPGEFRAVVRFRWFARDGATRTVRRTTRTCREPDQRPDLVGGRLQVLPGPGGVTTYRLPVRNRGRTPAGPFAVTLTAGGAEVARAQVAGLAPRTTTTVELHGPDCTAAQRPELTIDAGDAVDEVSETGATLVPVCPSSGG